MSKTDEGYPYRLDLPGGFSIYSVAEALPELLRLTRPQQRDVSTQVAAEPAGGCGESLATTTATQGRPATGSTEERPALTAAQKQEQLRPTGTIAATAEGTDTPKPVPKSRVLRQTLSHVPAAPAKAADETVKRRASSAMKAPAPRRSAKKRRQVTEGSSRPGARSKLMAKPAKVATNISKKVNRKWRAKER
jgi:hypothetical protein